MILESIRGLLVEGLSLEALQEKLNDFIKPRNEKDYYSLFGWLVSRRLALVLALGISILCIVFLWGQIPAKSASPQSGETCKTYHYNSIPLRFASGKVEILAKSGYTAYIGEIENGIVKGHGKLFDKAGNLVYEGAFDANKFNGDGKLYYPNGQIQYEGVFEDNLFSGEGKLYREDGTLKYEGSFNNTCMEGTGILYNAVQEPVYTGSFQRDRIIYQAFLGKEAPEVAQMYTGKRFVYTGAEAYCVYMEEIDAIYFGTDASNTLEETFAISGIYVLAQDIVLDGEVVSDMPAIGRMLGEPVYEGNTLLEAKDGIALNKMCERTGKEVLYGKLELKESQMFDDVIEILDFQKDYPAYIYVYEKENILYTFFCKDKDSGFAFYMIGY